MVAEPKVMHVITSLETGGAERMLERLVLARRERPLSFHVVSLLPGGAVAGRLRAAGIPGTVSTTVRSGSRSLNSWNTAA